MATGRARGFAFVEMSTDEEAQKAITELNEYQLGGRGLTVNEARPKPAALGGFGGGGFGGGDSRRAPVRAALVAVAEDCGEPGATPGSLTFCSRSRVSYT